MEASAVVATYNWMSRFGVAIRRASSPWCEEEGSIGRKGGDVTFKQRLGILLIQIAVFCEGYCNREKEEKSMNEGPFKDPASNVFFKFSSKQRYSMSANREDEQKRKNQRMVDNKKKERVSTRSLRSFLACPKTALDALIPSVLHASPYSAPRSVS